MPGVEACDIALATLAASIAALHVLAFVDGGEPATQNGTLEIALPVGERGEEVGARTRCAAAHGPTRRCSGPTRRFTAHGAV